jgi:hypothetical protein
MVRLGLTLDQQVQRAYKRPHRQPTDLRRMSTSNNSTPAMRCCTTGCCASPGGLRLLTGRTPVVPSQRASGPPVTGSFKLYRRWACWPPGCWAPSPPSSPSLQHWASVTTGWLPWLPGWAFTPEAAARTVAKAAHRAEPSAARPHHPRRPPCAPPDRRHLPLAQAADHRIRRPALPRGLTGKPVPIHPQPQDPGASGPRVGPSPCPPGGNNRESALATSPDLSRPQPKRGGSSTVDGLAVCFCMNRVVSVGACLCVMVGR